MGDGVLVYFGYPRAHDDDAERAVRAGLELIAAVAGLNTRTSLQTRVGIATGVVVVGELIGSGEAQERGIKRQHSADQSISSSALFSAALSKQTVWFRRPQPVSFRRRSTCPIPTMCPNVTHEGCHSG